MGSEMKIAVSADRLALDSPVDPMFGRCRVLLFVDPQTMQFEALDNPGADAVGGAGIQAAQAVVRRRAASLVTGNVGPNAMQVLERLGDTHCRRYYLGIINERRAKAHLDRGGPGSAEMAHDWYLKAMDAYEQALENCSPDNQDAALRWNTCARILNESKHMHPSEEPREVQLTDGYE